MTAVLILGIVVNAIALPIAGKRVLFLYRLIASGQAGSGRKPLSVVPMPTLAHRSPNLQPTAGASAAPRPGRMLWVTAAWGACFVAISWGLRDAPVLRFAALGVVK